MKILQLVTKRQYRGAEVFASNLSSELIMLGHEILFVGLYKNNKDILEVENATNIDLIENPKKPVDLVLIKKLADLVNKEKPDIVQCNGSDTLKYMALSSYITRNTPILYRNISIISKWITSSSQKVLYRFLFRRIQFVTCVGEQARTNFINTINYPQEKIAVIRRGIPVKQYNSEASRKILLKRFNLDQNSKLVIHVGNFSPEKNHNLLIKIFSKLKLSHPDIKLICVGDGVLYDLIQDAITNRNLEDTVFLAGFEKKISQMIAASDCLVLPSFIEGVPGVILEAAIQSKPSIASNVGGVKEVLVDKITGYLIENGNIDLFTEKIIELTSNRDLRDKMGEKAKEIALSNFSPLQNAKIFEKLYYQLLDKPSNLL